MSRTLVAGAAFGIGAAVARRLSGAGHLVGVVDVDGDAARSLAAEIIALGGASVGIEADLTILGEVERAVEGFADRAGGIDGLVNCVGGFMTNAQLEDVTLDEWEKVVGLNLTAPFLLIKEAVVHLRKSPCARIVNIASVAGRTAVEGSSIPYSAAKAGLIGLTRRAAVELAADGIALNAIAPGLVDSPRVREVHEERLGGLLETVPAGRLATTDEIAAAVEYLLSAEAGYLVGAVLDINGGRIPV